MFGGIALVLLSALPQQGVENEVARLLEARCAACHSADSDEPKARKKWAEAANLVATIDNPDILVPGDPEDSELYLLIVDGDMPPEDADEAPFNEIEIALVRAWILDGAPAPAADAVAAIDADGQTADGADDSDELSPLLGWLGHFHPLIVHFPVGLLTAALLAEVLTLLRPAWKTSVAADFCLGLGALSALPSAALGWLLAASSSTHGPELELHRWLGTATAVMAVVAWWATRRYPQRRLLILLAVAAIVGATGHTGGVLSYGADWLALPF